jgi:broad specificity polyphosphatase/5'/3'-nucleotidase SurE
MWVRLADLASDMVAAVLDAGYPPEADVVSVNLPGDATADTPRRITSLARVGYDRLFERNGRDEFRHDFGGGFTRFDGLAGSDIEAARQGEISITPIRLPGTGSLPDDLASRLRA